MSSFQFGAGAIHTPESEARFTKRRDSVIESIRPANIIELLLLAHSPIPQLSPSSTPKFTK